MKNRKRIVRVWFDDNALIELPEGGLVRGCWRAELGTDPAVKGRGWTPECAFVRCVNAAIAKAGCGNPTKPSRYRMRKLPV